MVRLEKLAAREVTGANYITAVTGIVHPDRVLAEHDFLYMLDGEWEIMEDGVAYPMRSDDCLILPAKRHHYGRTLCSPGNRHIYFHIVPTKAELQGTTGADSSFFELPSLFSCRRYPQVRRYFQEIVSIFWSEGKERENRLSLLVNLLLCTLVEIKAEDGASGEGDWLVEMVCRELHANPQRFFSAPEIAELCGVCPKTLNNRFLRAMGRTFCAYQTELKLRMVRDYLLHQPGARLHEAALNFGFCDEFHLSRVFKKKFGVSPRAFRCSAGDKARSLQKPEE